MKRFYTKKRRKSIVIGLFIGLLILLFFLLSLFTLKKNIAQNMFLCWDKKEFDSFLSVNQNLDKFLDLYVFDNHSTIISNSLHRTISLDGDEMTLELLKNNLKKLGIDSEVSEEAFGKIKRGNDSKIVTLKKKDYARINIFLPQKYMYLKETILNDYQDLIINILERDELLFEIGGLASSYDSVNNSTEIVALIIYYIIGD